MVNHDLRALPKGINFSELVTGVMF